MSDCANFQINLEDCSCTYSCNKKGKCCECLKNHRSRNQLPACFFPPEIEKTYDRSFVKFIEFYKNERD